MLGRLYACLSVCGCMCVCVFVRDLKNGCSVLTCILVKTERVLPIGQQFSLAAKIVEKSSNQRWYSLISANCRQRYYGGGRDIKGTGKRFVFINFQTEIWKSGIWRVRNGRDEGGERRGVEGVKDESLWKHHYFLIKLPIIQPPLPPPLIY